MSVTDFAEFTNKKEMCKKFYFVMVRGNVIKEDAAEFLEDEGIMEKTGYDLIAKGINEVLNEYILDSVKVKEATDKILETIIVGLPTSETSTIAEKQDDGTFINNDDYQVIKGEIVHTEHLLDICSINDVEIEEKDGQMSVSFFEDEKASKAFDKFEEICYKIEGQ